MTAATLFTPKNTSQVDNMSPEVDLDSHTSETDFYSMEDDVPQELKQQRADEIMEILAAAIEKVAASDDYKKAMDKLLFPVALVPAAQVGEQTDEILANVIKILPQLKGE